MATSPTEHIRDLIARISVLEERDGTRRAVLEELKALTRQERDERKTVEEKAREEITQLRRELAEARQETAVLKKLFEEQVKKADQTDARRWAVIALVISALFSLASGLIVTLAKK